jgi:zinc/manganese transport system substrate-binding protein
MKKILLTLFLVSIATNARAEFQIFACEMEWASLAREITGKYAKVVSGSGSHDDAGSLSVTRDTIKNIRSADMIFCSGGGLDESWLQYGLGTGKNKMVAAEPERILFAYNYAVVRPEIKAADASFIRPVALRVHLNPNNILPIAAEFTRRISIFDKPRAAYYQKSYEQFVEKWQKLIPVWEGSALALKGKKVIVYDDSWKGLTSWLGLEVVGKIELKKGMLENNKKMAELIEVIKNNDVAVVILGHHEDKNFALKLSRLTKVRIMALPFTVGGVANSGNLSQMFSTTINLLSTTCPDGSCPPISIKSQR